jgi:hypothetical protein
MYTVMFVAVIKHSTTAFKICEAVAVCGPTVVNTPSKLPFGQDFMRFDVLMAVSVKITVIWDVVLSSLINAH